MTITPIQSMQSEQEAFRAGASFRIYGADLDIDALTREFGLSPDHKHKQGESDPGKRPYPHDMWSLASPLGKGKELEQHLNWLAERLLPHKQRILALTNKFKVDIYCWKNCFTEQTSITISSKALRVFTQLNLDFQVSLLCLPPESTAEPRG